jgi:hypothetical protein
MLKMLKHLPELVWMPKVYKTSKIDDDLDYNADAQSYYKVGGCIVTIQPIYEVSSNEFVENK